MVPFSFPITVGEDRLDPLCYHIVTFKVTQAQSTTKPRRNSLRIGKTRYRKCVKFLGSPAPNRPARLRRSIKRCWRGLHRIGQGEASRACACACTFADSPGHAPEQSVPGELRICQTRQSKRPAQLSLSLSCSVCPESRWTLTHTLGRSRHDSGCRGRANLRAIGQARAGLHQVCTSFGPAFP